MTTKQKELAKSKFKISVEVDWHLGCVRKGSLIIVEEEMDLDGKILKSIVWDPDEFQINHDTDTDTDLHLEATSSDKEYHDINLHIDTEISLNKSAAVLEKMQENPKFAGELLKLLKKHDIDLKEIQNVDEENDEDEGYEHDEDVET